MKAFRITIAAIAIGAKRMVKPASLALLAIHFALTLLYVFPENPLKLPFLGLLDSTVGVYARQNWSLFAPNPIASNQALLAKCLTADESVRETSALVAGSRTDGWSDVSMPFWIAFQHNRFTAYDRLIRPQTNTIRSYLSGGHHLAVWERACTVKHEQDACDVFEEGLERARTAAAPALRKLGSAYCKDVMPLQAITHVALRVRVTPAAPWSERHNASFTRPYTDLSLGIYPIDRQVATTGLFMATALR